MHAEAPGLARGSANDRTIAQPGDDYGLAAQFGIIALLDRSVKRVHVDVDDFSHNLPAAILVWLKERGEQRIGQTIDCPASSSQTQELMGWRPIRSTLIPDLDQAHYFATEAAG